MAVLLREAIGGSLRRVRTARRHTLREVSRRARVSLGYLSEVERGRKEPSSELLAAICEALDVALPDVLSDAAEAMWASMSSGSAMSSGSVLSPDLRVRPIGGRQASLRLADRAALPATVAPGAALPGAERPAAPAGSVRAAA
ncbi:MAG: helix-turn-helix domain-containing protein [Pseudonocardia sp.]